MKEGAKALKKDMADLEVLHRDSASLEHAIRKYDDRWHEFLPSRFVYSFFIIPHTSRVFAAVARSTRTVTDD